MGLFNIQWQFIYQWWSYPNKEFIEPFTGQLFVSCKWTIVKSGINWFQSILIYDAFHGFLTLP